MSKKFRSKLWRNSFQSFWKMALGLPLELRSSSKGKIMLYQIIVRNGSANHYASSDNLTCAVAIFHALSKTFKHIELWQGGTLFQEYKNI